MSAELADAPEVIENLPGPEVPAPEREENTNPAFPGTGRAPGRRGPVGRGNNPGPDDKGAEPSIAGPDPDLPDMGACAALPTFP